MISNLGAQIIYSRGEDESISYDLKPHNVDITELVQQYKFVTNTNIVRDPYDHLIGYRSASHDIDQVFFVYDTNNPETGTRYYVLRNNLKRLSGAQGLFAILKLDYKENDTKSSRSRLFVTEKMSLTTQRNLYGFLAGLSIVVGVLGENTLVQYCMIMLAVCSVLGLIQVARSNREHEEFLPVTKGTQIVGFRHLEHLEIDTEIIAKALDLGFEDRVRVLFDTPEEYLEEHLHALEQEVDLLYDTQAGQLTPSRYVGNYSLEEMKIINEIERGGKQ